MPLTFSSYHLSKPTRSIHVHAIIIIISISQKINIYSYKQISRQATINVGTIGHVAHGKSTVVKAISGVHVCTSPPTQERESRARVSRVGFGEKEPVGGGGALAWPVWTHTHTHTHCGRSQRRKHSAERLHVSPL